MAHSSSISTTGASTSTLKKVGTFARAFVKHNSDRLTYSRMMGMSNRQLADIGITRDDIRDRLSMPMQTPMF